MIRIEQAKLEHLEHLVPLFDAYRVWYGKSSDQETAMSFLKERMISKESIVYMAYDGAEALGFTQLYPLFSSTRMKRMWLLNDLFVAPEHRGKGVSKQLIATAQDLARQTDAAGVLLETEKSNDIGNRLYPATGFELEKNNFYFWTKE